MHHTFDMKRKVILKHDAIPIIFPASLKSKKIPERRDKSRGAFVKREKIGVKAQSHCSDNDAKRTHSIG